MKIADLGDVALHYREDGPPDGAPVVFANALGCDLRIWDDVIERLPAGLRAIRYDMRGHGLSSCPPGPYSMGALIRDAERLLEALAVRDCVFVGLSIGGMVAQGLAVKRLDLVRAMVLSNTAAKIGTPEIWQDRIEAVRKGGIAALSEATLARWFSRRYRQSSDCTLWQNMLNRQPIEGYLGCCAAISGTDFYTPTASLTLPTLVLAGSEDGSTPPDLVRETAGLIKGARFHLIRGAGHLPCIDRPEDYAAVLTTFLREIGHVES
ncbi:3-oxoadipate enol-lactonase [Rhodovulum sulfidophilum]|uniref:3-oxoadipate enol-lactonase n=1 Tax=Rhodovulum sulfidophilum TaxID=35806 RepID=A0ABS1RSV2_RHOSU|nr:3-oxoadipate enol-lactonase [Rhodovulum sulfidophilum]MBL3608738.1 3-oxoadipate enol-lactonase [Rhodovulum sulfidophilum]MCE8458604.1 3-oxoadipate enol-lactonase [Rhodovulum sulfidophilum]